MAFMAGSNLLYMQIMPSRGPELLSATVIAGALGVVIGMIPALMFLFFLLRRK
jgi:hypothetical protein